MNHFEDTFTTPDGVSLFRQGWVPDEPRASVCFIHGAFEHSGRFAEVCCWLAGAGFEVHSLDLRGHGRSEGEIGPHTPFFSLLKDVDSFVAYVRDGSRGRKTFLMGQSLGGALALMSASIEDVSGVILCAPACRMVVPPTTIIFAYAIGKILPNLKFKAFEAHLIARDPAVALAYENDPLVNRQGIPLRPFTEFMHSLREKQREFEKKDIPLLIFHGTEDKLIDIRGSRELFKRSCSRDKTLEIIPHCYHDLLNDPDRKKIYDKIVAWLNSHV